MVVHSNDTGDNGIARTLNSLRALRDLGGRLRADELYFSVRDRNGLFFLRRRPRSIDNSDMVEHEDWCINAYAARWLPQCAILIRGIAALSFRRRRRSD